MGELRGFEANLPGATLRVARDRADSPGN